MIIQSACVALGVLCVMVSSLNADEPTDQEAAIRQVLEKQAKAWNQGDLKGFMRGYWKSEKLSFFSGNAKTQSWQATLERYQRKYQGEGNEMGKLTFSELEIQRLGDDSAFVRGRFTLITSKGKPTGLFTLVMKKTAEGWRIIHDHTSS